MPDGFPLFKDVNESGGRCDNAKTTASIEADTDFCVQVRDTPFRILYKGQMLSRFFE